jgi:hypothetical protein
MRAGRHLRDPEGDGRGDGGGAGRWWSLARRGGGAVSAQRARRRGCKVLRPCLRRIELRIRPCVDTFLRFFLPAAGLPLQMSYAVALPDCPWPLRSCATHRCHLHARCPQIGDSRRTQQLRGRGNKLPDMRILVKLV